MATTTHGTVARELESLAKRLEEIPAGYRVSDGGTLSCVRAAAKVLREHDEQVGTLTVKLRDALAALRKIEQAALPKRNLAPIAIAMGDIAAAALAANVRDEAMAPRNP